MIKRLKFPKIFFGWWTVLSCSVIGFLGVGFVGQGFSVFFKPIASELELSRAVTSIATSIQTLGRGIWGPVGGWASDKYGPRLVMLLGISCLVLGCIAMYFIDSLWTFLVVWGVLIGVGHTLGCTIITDKAIVNWFVKKSGKALSLKFAIQSLSGILLLPLIAWLVTTQGWQETFIIGGIAIALVSFPLVWFFVKPHQPEYYGLLPDGATFRGEAMEANQTTDKGKNYTNDAEVVEFTFRQTIKTPAYWLVIVVGSIHGLAMPMISVHCIPFLTDMEIDPVKAAGIMAIILTSSVPSRLVTGFIIDYMKTSHLRFIIVMGYLLQAIGVTMFLFNKSIAMIYVWFVLYGIGSGAAEGVQLPLWLRYFGRRAYGSIIGSATTMHAPVGLLAPIYIGWVYDTTGSYMNILVLMAISLVVAGVGACFLLPPKSPVQVKDLSKLV